MRDSVESKSVESKSVESKKIASKLRPSTACCVVALNTVEQELSLLCCSCSGIIYLSLLKIYSLIQSKLSSMFLLCSMFLFYVVALAVLCSVLCCCSSIIYIILCSCLLCCCSSIISSKQAEQAQRDDIDAARATS